MWNDFLKYLWKSYQNPILLLAGFVGSALQNGRLTLDWLGLGLLIALFFWVLTAFLAALYAAFKRRVKKTDN